jgi:arylsulfatase
LVLRTVIIARVIRPAAGFQLSGLLCFRRGSVDDDRVVHQEPVDGRERVMSDSDERTRAVLPIPDQPYAGRITFDAKDPASAFPPIEPLRPPAGAPNVIIALIDDVGFGASSAFGGPCETPTAERLAAAGLKYSRFHTTALCSPTRQALLTGRNHHSVGMGGVAEMATSAPGYSSIRPNSAAPLAEVLMLNGYSTAQFGKCHEVPVWETSPMGPFRQWPTGSGFEHFYGFIGGVWGPNIRSCGLTRANAADAEGAENAS